MNSTQWMHALCMICMICYCYIEEYHLEVQNLMIIAKLIQRRRLREFNYAYRIREYSAPTWYLIVRFGLPCSLAFIMTSAVYFGYTALPYVNWLDFMVDVCYIPTTLCKYFCFFAFSPILCMFVCICISVLTTIFTFRLFHSLITLDTWFVYVCK